MKKRILLGLVTLIVGTSIIACGTNDNNEPQKEVVETTVISDEEEIQVDENTEDEAEVKLESSVSVVEDFSYSEKEDGIYIKGYNGEATIIEIPESINGQPVVGIVYQAFSDSDIVSLKISDNVKIIGQQAFYNCDRLETVDFGTSVETIEAAAFDRCDKLNNIVLPASLTLVNSAFAECDSLTSVIDNSSCTAISGATYYSSAIKEYTVPSTVTKIETDAFGETTDLVITIPATVTEIHDEAFADAVNVTIKGAAGSYAETYAKEMGITFEAQ